ncbi:MAG: LytR/AlgR family response regulator transcription factor [Terriglobia bacterium]
MPIRTIVVDDEELGRKRISALLKSEADIELVAECGDAATANQAIVREKPDLLLLDIQMPGQDGFSVLEALEEEQRPVVVFVTAYDQYALRAFEAQALDYLLKPFNRARFQKVMQRVRVQIARKQRDEVDERLASLIKQVRGSGKYLGRIVIRSAGRVSFLHVDDVDWFEACANYVQLHIGKESHLLRGTMGTLEKRLDPDKFVRIHRCTIVRIDRIKELLSSFEGDYLVVLRDGTRLSLSRGYRRHFEQVVEPGLRV